MPGKANEIDVKQCEADTSKFSVDMSAAAIDAWKGQDQKCPGLVHYEFQKARNASGVGQDLQLLFERAATLGMADAETMISATSQKYGTDGKLDINGLALRTLLTSELALDKIDKAMIGQAKLAGISQRIQSDESEILGQHDIAAAESALIKTLKARPADVSDLSMNLGRSLDVLDESKYPKLVAKLCRDLALVKESSVASGINIYEQPTGLNTHEPLTVAKLLERSEKLDPSNPDMAALQEIAKGQQLKSRQK